MRTVLWLLTIVGSLFGAIYCIAALSVAKSAMQEAAWAAIAVAFAVIPYCLARAVSEIW